LWTTTNWEFASAQVRSCSGGFGRVYTCMNIETREIRAVKIIRKTKASTEDEERLRKEVAILKQLVLRVIIRITPT
jgi:hypothetical protein